MASVIAVPSAAASESGPASSFEIRNLGLERGPYGHAILGDRMVFEGFEASTGGELWATDGTPAGTVLLKDINPGPDGSSPWSFAVIGDRAVFGARDPDHGSELWVTDGSAEGTQLIADINPGAEGGFPQGFVQFGDAVLFWANDGEHGAELWVTDGTPAGTQMVRDIYPGFDGSSPHDFVVAGERVFFNVTTSDVGASLWVTDRTLSGTNPVAVFDAGRSIALNGSLFFEGASPGVGYELWISDGTQMGTTLLADIVPGPESSFPGPFATVDGHVVFGADDGLWVTDGTGVGTHRIADVRSSQFTVVDGVVLFAGHDADSGGEPWITDGTVHGTRRIADINPGPLGSNPRFFTPVGDRVVFATGQALTNQIWATDFERTELLTEAFPAMSTTFGPFTTYGFTPLGDRLFFAAGEATAGGEPWITDGTASGTGLLVDLNPGPSSSRIQGPSTVLGQRLLFSADGADGQPQLWAISPRFTGRMAEATTLDEIVASSDYNPDVHGEILRLYPAFFNREADAAGARYWISYVYEESGRSLDDITGYFASDQQPEFVNAYADIAPDDHEAYLTRVYWNMFDRPPDPLGFAYWLDVMSSGALDRGGVVRYMALDTEYVNLYPYRPSAG